MGCQRILYNGRNHLRDAVITASSVKPVAAVVSRSGARAGNGTVRLTGEYTGMTEAEFEIRIAASAAGRSSAPVFSGVGNGVLADVSVGNLEQQNIRVTLSDMGTVTRAATLELFGYTLTARSGGAGGNAITITVDDSALTVADSGYATFEALEAGRVNVTGQEWDFGAQPLAGGREVAENTPRIMFEGDPQIYRQYKTFRNNDWEYHFVPALARGIAKGTPVQVVAGSRVVTVHAGAVAETYPGIVTIYDFLSALASSALVVLSGAAVKDLLPNGAATLDLPLKTAAYHLPVGMQGAYVTGFDSLAVGADAPTEVVTVACIDNAILGAEVWSVTGTVSGALPQAQTDRDYAGGDYAFRIPAKYPVTVASNVAAVAPVVIDSIAYQSRTENQSTPPIGIKKGVLGAAGFSGTLRAVWTKYVDQEACRWEDAVIEGTFRPEFLGLTGGDDMAVAEALKSRLLQMYEWRADFIRRNTASNITIGPAEWLHGTITVPGATHTSGDTWTVAGTVKTPLAINVEVEKSLTGGRTDQQLSGDLANLEAVYESLGATSVSLAVHRAAVTKKVVLIPYSAFDVSDWTLNLTPNDPLLSDRAVIVSVPGVGTQTYPAYSPFNHAEGDLPYFQLEDTLNDVSLDTNWYMQGVVSGPDAGSYVAFVSPPGGFSAFWENTFAALAERTFEVTVTTVSFTGEARGLGETAAINHPGFTSEALAITFRSGLYSANDQANCTLTVTLIPGATVTDPDTVHTISEYFATQELAEARQTALEAQYSGATFALAITTVNHEVSVENPPVQYSAANLDLAWMDPYFTLLVSTLKKVYTEAAALALWDTLRDEMLLELEALCEADSDDISSTLADTGYLTRYSARADIVLLEAGIDPGKREGISISAGCWSDRKTDYWKIDGYAPIYNNVLYYSTKFDANGAAYSTNEFAFAIAVKCTQNLVYGDAVTLHIGGSGTVTSPRTYQVGDLFRIPVIGSRPVQFSGGVNGSDTLTWSVWGSVHGHFDDCLLAGDSVAYDSGAGLSFTVRRGGIPFSLGDSFAFTVEGGTFQFRKDGGAWSGVMDIGDTVALSDGLSAAFGKGVAPSFVAGDVYGFTALQPFSPGNCCLPFADFWQWTGGTAFFIGRFAETKTIDCLALDRHTLPTTAGISIQAANGNNNWVEIAAPEWRKGSIAVVLSTPVAADRVKVVITDGLSGTIGYLFAGMSLVSEASPAMALRRQYDVLHGKKNLFGSVYVGEASAGLLSWKNTLTQDEFSAHLEMVDYVKQRNNEPVIVIPHFLHPEEAMLCCIDSDSVEIVDELDFQPDETAHRIMSLSLPLGAVL